MGDAQKNLDKLLRDFPDSVEVNQVNIGRRFIKSMNQRDTIANGHGRYKTLYDHYLMKSWEFETKLQCSLVDKQKPTCVLKIEMTLK